MPRPPILLFVGSLALLACARAVPQEDTPVDGGTVGAPTGGADGEAGRDLRIVAAGDLAGCGPWSCQGCCLPSGECRGGFEDQRCGAGGGPCVDCAAQGSGCVGGQCRGCAIDCQNRRCGDGDGCGGICQPGSGCCAANCGNKKCGEGDGCGGTCGGPCPWGSRCNGNHQCECGPAPHFKVVNGRCLPSCGVFLEHEGKPDQHMGCCAKGCRPGLLVGDKGSTWDCTYCCASPPNTVACL